MTLAASAAAMGAPAAAQAAEPPGFVATNTAVVPFDTGANAPGTAIGAAGAEDVAITPDGRMAYVVRATDNQVTRVDIALAGVGRSRSPESARTRSAIAITPNGQTAYVVSDDGVDADLAGEQHRGRRDPGGRRPGHRHHAGRREGVRHGDGRLWSR